MCHCDTRTRVAHEVGRVPVPLTPPSDPALTPVPLTLGDSGTQFTNISDLDNVSIIRQQHQRILKANTIA